jgi:hypothetical protein
MEEEPQIVEEVINGPPGSTIAPMQLEESSGPDTPPHPNSEKLVRRGKAALGIF